MRPSLEFLTVKEAKNYFDKKGSSLFYHLYRRDKAKGKSNRFKFIDNVLYVHKDYRNMYQDKENLYWDLYFKVEEDFSNTFQMAKFFSTRCDRKVTQIYEAFNKNNIRREETLDYYINLLQEYINEKNNV